MKPTVLTNNPLFNLGFQRQDPPPKKKHYPNICVFLTQKNMMTKKNLELYIVNNNTILPLKI